MTGVEDRIRFLAEPLRLRIALLCRDESLSLNQIAKALERAPGSLSQPGTMVGHGALTARKRRGSARGRQTRVFRLAPAWRPAVDEAQRRARPAWPTPGQDLVVVPFSSLRAVGRILESEVGGVDWAAEIRGGAAGLLVAPTAEDGGSRILAMLSEVADGLATLRVEKVMSPLELRRWSQDLGRSVPALGRGEKSD
jgi:hypothetical protein